MLKIFLTFVDEDEVPSLPEWVTLLPSTELFFSGFLLAGLTWSIGMFRNSLFKRF